MQHFAGFVYREVRLLESAIEVQVEAHAGRRGRCSQWRQPSPGYDRLPEQRWQFVPLWGIPVWFLYAPRRVRCRELGVVIEQIPCSVGGACWRVQVVTNLETGRYSSSSHFPAGVEFVFGR